VIDHIDRRADKPAYKQLADQLRARIESGELGPGAPLPAESELVASTGLNRTTVRNAMKILRSEGLIEVQQGRGTFVRAHRLIRRYPLDGLRMEHALIGKVPPSPQGDLWTAQTGTTAKVDVTREYQQTQAPPELAEAFGAADAPALPLLCRTYMFIVDERPHQVTRSYLRWDMVDGTPLTDPANERPHRGTMAQLADLGVHITAVEITARTRMPSPDEVRLLDIAEGAPVFVLRRVMYAQDRAVEVGESIVPGDRIELAFRVDLTEPA
jgi:GntR family transcriptional regulator